MLPAFGDLNTDVIVDGLNNPWEIVFGPDGEIYFTERDGRIWKLSEFGDAKVIQTFPKSGALLHVSMGIALHSSTQAWALRCTLDVSVDFAPHRHAH